MLWTSLWKWGWVQSFIMIRKISFHSYALSLAVIMSLAATQKWPIIDHSKPIVSVASKSVTLSSRSSASWRVAEVQQKFDCLLRSYLICGYFNQRFRQHKHVPQPNVYHAKLDWIKLPLSSPVLENTEGPIFKELGQAMYSYKTHPFHQGSRTTSFKTTNSHAFRLP